MNSHAQGANMLTYGNEQSSQTYQDNFAFTQQNYYNSYGQRSSNPNFQYQFYPRQSFTSHPTNSEYDKHGNQNLFVIPEQHSINPIFSNKS